MKVWINIKYKLLIKHNVWNYVQGYVIYTIFNVKVT